MKIEIKNRWTGAVLYATELPDGSDFAMRTAVERAARERANLAGANLADAYLAGANLADANLADAYLAGANLADAYLAGANLAGANLADAYLAGAYLAGAKIPEWAIPFARIGACGQSIAWLARCKDANSAFAALCGEWRNWLDSEGAPMDADGEAIVTWAREKAGPEEKRGPWHARACDRKDCEGERACKAVSLRAEDLERFAPGTTPACSAWPTCSCPDARSLRAQIWQARAKAPAEAA